MAGWDVNTMLPKYLRRNRWLSRSSVLWLIPVLLLVHNLEEALFMPHILPLDPQYIPRALRLLLPEVTYAQFLLVLLPVTVLPFLIAARGDLHREGSGGIFLLLGLQAAVLLNVFSHIASALVLGGYVPGLLTALLPNLPFSIYVFRKATRERWISRWALLSLPALALFVHGPVLIGLMALSGWLVRSIGR